MIQNLFFDSLPSTNTFAKENIASLSLPTLITANEQTAGRGRRGNSFFSPKNTGLYMTLALEEKYDSSLITPAVAVAVCDVLTDTGIDAKIKWVNDIFIKNKKVCGILCERCISNNKSYLIIGIGINITTSIFPDDLTSAGSININCDKEKLAKDISSKIIEYIEKNDNEEIVIKYREKLFIIGKDIRYYKNNIEFKGTVKDINDQCNLIITLPDGNEDTLSSGEISIIL